MRRIVTASVLAMLVGSSGAALAQPSLAEPVPEAVTASKWYGWQVLAFDGLCAALVGIGSATDTEALGAIGLSTYLFSGAMVHSIHGNSGRALASVFVVRPVALLAAGASTICVGACDDQDDANEKAIGILVAGSLLDALVGWKTTRIVPTAEPDGTRGLALVGTF